MNEKPFRWPHHASWLRAGLVFLLMAYPLHAQTFSPKVSRLKGSQQTGASNTAPATTHDPERVRALLQAVHGFTRAGLDAASTDVPRILTTFIDDAAESMLVRRQAVKALALYPTDGNLAFIESRIGSAPLGLRRLYVNSLVAFAETRPGIVAVALKPLLEDADITVRYAAAGVAGKHKSAPAIRALLEDRLGKEKNSSLHKEIEDMLKAK